MFPRRFPELWLWQQGKYGWYICQAHLLATLKMQRTYTMVLTRDEVLALYGIDPFQLHGYVLRELV